MSWRSLHVMCWVLSDSWIHKLAVVVSAEKHTCPHNPLNSHSQALAHLSLPLSQTKGDRPGRDQRKKTMSKQPKNGPQIIIIIESLLVWKDNDFLCPFCYAPNKKHWSSLHHSLPSVLLEIVRECLKAFHIVWDELWIKLRICHTMSQKSRLAQNWLSPFLLCRFFMWVVVSRRHIKKKKFQQQILSKWKEWKKLNFDFK